MKLDTKAFRYLSPEDWRVLTGTELGSKNHEVVPTPLIIQLSGLRAGNSGAQRSISTLAKAGLIAREKNIKYDGYRLTYGGLDYLALHGHTRSDAIVHLGSQMGVGKESDIYLVTSPAISSSRLSTPTPSQLSTEHTQQPVEAILKIHRLGRISFRTIRTKRAYHGNRSHASWHYLSRLSAHKEYLCMRALYDAGFRVPTPLAWNRHTIVMSLVPGVPLRQVPLSAFELAAGGRRIGKEARDEEIARLYGDCLEIALSLAEVGVIHGDFNEFNILVQNVPDPEKYPDDYNSDDDNNPILNPTTSPLADSSQPPSSSATDARPTTTPTSKPPQMIPHLIDFPQVTSLSHPQASFYFSRDIDCIQRFFRKRYHFEPTDPSYPSFEEAESRLRNSKRRRIDVEIEAMGFNRKMAKELGAYYEEVVEGEKEGGEDIENAEEDEEEDGETDLESKTLGQLDATEQGMTPSKIFEEADAEIIASMEKLEIKEDIIHPNPYELSVNYSPSEAGVERDDTASEINSKLGRISTRSRRPQPQPRTRAKMDAGWSI